MELAGLRRSFGCCMLALGLAVADNVAAQQQDRDSSIRKYADAYDVSYDEAKRRLTPDDRPSLMRIRMRNEASDTFAGLRIEHSPTYRYVVRFTGNAQAQLRRFTSDPDFVAEVAPRSLVFMESIFDEAAALVGDLMSTGEVVESTSQILITTEDVPGAKRRLAPLLRRFDFIQVEYGQPPTPM